MSTVTPRQAKRSRQKANERAKKAELGLSSYQVRRMRKAANRPTFVHRKTKHWATSGIRYAIGEALDRFFRPTSTGYRTASRRQRRQAR